METECSCFFCDQPLDDDDTDIVDTDQVGYVHGACLDEHVHDAPGRAADFYSDRGR